MVRAPFMGTRRNAISMWRCMDNDHIGELKNRLILLVVYPVGMEAIPRHRTWPPFQLVCFLCPNNSWHLWAIKVIMASLMPLRRQWRKLNRLMRVKKLRYSWRPGEGNSRIISSK
jgi:hypothetical protein